MSEQEIIVEIEDNLMRYNNYEINRTEYLNTNRKLLKLMEATQEAKELVDKFMFISDRRVFDAKQCASICVDEILKENERINQGGQFPTPLTEYWQEVKKQIRSI